MSAQTTLEFNDNSLVPLLFGEHNAHLTYLEKKLGIEISGRGNQLSFDGDQHAIKTAQYVLNTLWDKLKDKQNVGTAEIDAAMRFFNDRQGSENKENKDAPANNDGSKNIIRTKKKTIAPRTPNQSKYIGMIQKSEMIFGIGPAGTGKTYLAVAAGVQMFLENKVERLVFCRPAVEAGENLGFLPGDMKDKVDPYLRPIYDALNDTLPFDFFEKKMETGEIEIAPLAFARTNPCQRLCRTG